MRKNFFVLASLLSSALAADQSPAPGATSSGSQTASFSRPLGLTAAQDGVLYVADTDNHSIRRITPEGLVTTLAGSSGEKGSADGKGGEARFNFPTGIAIDQGGTLYVTDAGNNAIRKISPDGMVTTLAGKSGVAGTDDGEANAARFKYPYGIAVDKTGNIYVTDLEANAVRKITAKGTVTTLAGKSSEKKDSRAKEARLDKPHGIAVDNSGNLYVCDGGSNTIRKISSSGAMTILAGTDAIEETKTYEFDRGFGKEYQTEVIRRNADGKGTAAGFASPGGIAIDPKGNLLVTDWYNGTVRQVTPDGVVTTLIGSEKATLTGSRSAERLMAPQGIAVDGTGRCYVATLECIRRIDPNGDVITLAGQNARGKADGGGYVARFKTPGGVAVDETGTVYVADSGNDVIRKIMPDGMVRTVAGLLNGRKDEDGRANIAKFHGPDGIAIDQARNIYVSDSLAQTIRKVTPDGMVTTLAGEEGKEDGADGVGKAAHFDNPHGLAVDRFGNVYVADAANSAVRKITPNGTVTTLAGSRNHEGIVDGKGTEARFVQPEGVAVDDAGIVWVADGRGKCIRRITPEGEVTTLMDVHGKPDEKGRLRPLRFDWPDGIAVDKAGNLYIAELGNEVVRKITPDGTVTTLAGKPETHGSVDGKGEEARFYTPESIAIDKDGNLYLSEIRNKTVRKISPDGVVTTLAGKFGEEGDMDGAAAGPIQPK